MKLTKEECLKHLYALKELSCTHAGCSKETFEQARKNIKVLNEAIANLENLINEHFENPPLKFEELELYFPYWDDEEKLWCYFTTLNKDLKTGVKVSISDTPMIGAFRFEKGRFYLKEVKVND